MGFANFFRSVMSDTTILPHQIGHSAVKLPTLDEALTETVHFTIAMAALLFLLPLMIIVALAVFATTVGRSSLRTVGLARMARPSPA
jgi:lipopolysaccharide/colanic/teichoic acid biosynthesis glycosyltransferase